MTEIGVPVEEIAARRERVDKTRRFERPDRVAVIPSIGTRFLAPWMGVRFRELYGNLLFRVARYSLQPSSESVPPFT